MFIEDRLNTKSKRKASARAYVRSLFSEFKKNQNYQEDLIVSCDKKLLLSKLPQK